MLICLVKINNGLLWKYSSFSLLVKIKWPTNSSAFFCGHETMFNCSQNCLNNWNYAVLCFKRPFSYRGMNACPICEASLSYHTLCVGNLVWLAKKKRKKSASPHIFWSRPMTRNWRLFGGLNNDNEYTKRHDSKFTYEQNRLKARLWVSLFIHDAINMLEWDYMYLYVTTECVQANTWIHLSCRELNSSRIPDSCMDELEYEDWYVN